MAGAKGAREALEDAVRAAVAEAAECRPGARPCESCERNVAEILAAAGALAADEVLKAADMTLGRAREAEAGTLTARGELADLEGRLAQVITAALRDERARADRAEGKVAQALEGIGSFLEQYGKSEVPMFKVAIDLANSLRKVLGDSEGAPGA